MILLKERLKLTIKCLLQNNKVVKKIVITYLFLPFFSFSQDTAFKKEKRTVTLPEVMIRSGFDYKKLLTQIQNDSSFYKAFKNLRILNYHSYNDIKMYDKNGQNIKASLFSHTVQKRENGCRTTKVIEETTTGDFYKENHQFNYTTAEIYASLFFTKGKICGENNAVNTAVISAKNKSGIEKHKEQLKMLFFNPGKKISGIPFIGNKLDLYDEDAQKLYDYNIDIQDINNTACYVLSIVPKQDLGWLKKDKIVVDEMTTWFDINTLDVLKRNYSLSYSAGVYNFSVQMEVEMQKFDNLLVPKILRYKGNWGILFKKKENAVFTATLFNFKGE
jgi:hypothetical protein